MTKRRAKATDRYMAEVINFGGLPCVRADAMNVALADLGWNSDQLDWFVARPPAIDAAPISLDTLRALVA